jgi:N-acetylmuramoyl-L-alanine amidase
MKRLLILTLTICLFLFQFGCQRRKMFHNMDNNGANFLSQRSQSYQPPLIDVPKQIKPIIVVDAGHGGDDDGCHPKDVVDEKELTLATARLLKDNLLQMGYDVRMTRSSDIYLELDERVDFANKLKADLFVSVHFNSCKSTKPHGIEVFYCEKGEKFRIEESKELANCVLEKIIYFTKAKSRGVKTANFRVIKKTCMPAILVECGFLSNSDERRKCQDPLYQEVLAWGIARGVHEYIKSNPLCIKR